MKGTDSKLNGIIPGNPLGGVMELMVGVLPLLYCCEYKIDRKKAKIMRSLPFLFPMGISVS